MKPSLARPLNLGRPWEIENRVDCADGDNRHDCVSGCGRNKIDAEDFVTGDAENETALARESL